MALISRTNWNKLRVFIPLRCRRKFGIVPILFLFSTFFVIMWRKQSEYINLKQPEETRLYANLRIFDVGDEKGFRFPVYEHSVDLRILVLTYNRPDSLAKCLENLRDLQTDGFKVSLEIWIDREKETDKVHGQTLAVATSFTWTLGPVNIWVHARHVGLYGQWINTWRPQPDSKELALFIEDDVDVSRYGYRWLRALHSYYIDRTDVACYSLQDDNAVISDVNNKLNIEVPKPSNTPAYFYRIPGSWAMAPNPAIWRQFQDWFMEVRLDANFKPHVQEASLHTQWYKLFQSEHREDSMWTMWLIKFMSLRGLYCSYSNLPVYTRHATSSLASNRREPGLHFHWKPWRYYVSPQLLDGWKLSLIDFSNNPLKFNFDGSLE